MHWKIEPTISKNAAEFITYTKGNMSLIYATYYRWATVYVTSETKPILEFSEDEQGTKFEGYDHDLDQSYNSEIIVFSKGMNKNTKERLQEYGMEELENDGWELEESVIWIYGDLQINEC